MVLSEAPIGFRFGHPNSYNVSYKLFCTFGWNEFPNASGWPENDITQGNILLPPEGYYPGQNFYCCLSIDTKPYNGDDTKGTLRFYYCKDSDESLKEESTWIDLDYFEDFKEFIKKEHFMELGRHTCGAVGNWGYLNGLCHSARIYTKGLTKPEAQNNYDTTSSYHKDIIESKNK